MEKNNQLVKQIGITAAICGVLSLLFLPVISLLGTVNGVELLGYVFKSGDSEDIILGLLLIGIIGCGVAAIFAYALNKFKEGAVASIIGLLGYVIAMLFLIGKFESAEAIKLFGTGIWISIICFLAAALAPKLGGLTALLEPRGDTKTDKEAKSSDPRLLAKEETIRQKLQEKPLDIELLMQHANALWELGSIRDAAKQAEKVLSIDKAHRGSIALLAKVYHDLGIDDRSIEMLQLYAESSKSSPEDYWELAKLHQAIEGGLPKAIEVVEAGLKAFPDDVSLLIILTTLRMASDDIESALAVSSEDLRKLANSPEVLSSLLNTAIRSKKFIEAYNIADMLLQKDNTNMRAIHFAIASKLRADLQKHDTSKIQVDLDELSRLEISMFSDIETRHYDFLIGLARIALNGYSKVEFENVIRMLMEDPEIFPPWDSIVVDIILGITQSPQVLLDQQILLDQVIELSNRLQSDEFRKQTATLCKSIAQLYENKNKWSESEKYYNASLYLMQNDEVQIALERIALINKRAKRKRIGIIVGSTAVVALAIGVFFYFARGQIRVAVEQGATVQVLKKGEIVFEEVVNEADSLTHITTPFLFMGDYSIQVKKPGYNAESFVASIGFGRKTSIYDFTLTPLLGSIQVDSYPPKAKVYIDERYVGETPITVDSLLAKSTTLSLRSEGWDIIEKHVDIIPDSVVNLGTIRLNFVTDFDGNIYKTVKIGDQWWMAENLKVTHYRNGNPIPNVTDNDTWANLTTGSFCTIDNDKSYVNTYGRLYNWYAVDDSRNIAPEGWHVPSVDEWKTLVDYLGGFVGVGRKLREAGTTHWKNNDSRTNNESGFTALPGSCRNYNGDFGGIGGEAVFWSSTEQKSSSAWSQIIIVHAYGCLDKSSDKHWGFSIRCVRD